MDEQELRDCLLAAFEPFVRGFCKEADVASLAIEVHDDRIDADVTLSADDFQNIAGDVLVASALKQAFSALCRANDLTRGASLAFKKR
ncbi:MAG: hypothetical protein ACOY0T_08475 [Myxococcota bacterium]